MMIAMANLPSSKTIKSGIGYVCPPATQEDLGKNKTNPCRERGVFAETRDRVRTSKTWK